MFDQQPLTISCTYQNPRPFELLTVQRKFQFALSQRGGDVVRPLRSIGAVIPHPDRAASVFAFRNDAFKIRVIDRRSSTAMASLLTAGSSDGPLGTAHDFSTPPSSSRKS